MAPQGPIDPEALDDALLMPWGKLSGPALSTTLRNFAQVRYPARKLPVPLPASFWRSLKKYGSEEGCSEAGVLVYRAAIQVDSERVRLELARPTIGASRRLYRHHPTRRLLRVSIDVDSERDICSTTKDRARKRFESWLQTPICLLGKLAAQLCNACAVTVRRIGI